MIDDKYEEDKAKKTVLAIKTDLVGFLLSPTAKEDIDQLINSIEVK